LFGTVYAPKAQEKRVIAINMKEPTHMDPVSIGAKIISTGNPNEKTLVIGVNIMEGYHIYAYVTSRDAYIKSEVGFDLPEGITLKGELISPSPNPYQGKPGILIYTNRLQFEQVIKIDENLKKETKLKCWMYYQCCDAHICFPPQKKQIEIEFEP